MFARISKGRFAVVVVAASALALLSACGGKKTKAQMEAQAASSRGFETVTTPATELEKKKRDIEDKLNIPCGIGIGESTDESVAHNMSSDEARTRIAESVDALVQRLSESYAQNVNGEAKKIWEEGVRQLTNQHVSNSKVLETITQYNKENNRYKIYTLMVIDPKLFKNAVAESIDSREEEFELRVKKDEMMSKMDANIAEYDAKYRK